MEDSFSILLTLLLALLCMGQIVRSLLSKDRALLWSPITFFALSIIYYCVLPMFNSSRFFEGIDTSSRSLVFHIGALLSFVSIMVGFYVFQPNNWSNWKNWNNCLTVDNAKKVAIALFVLALACYIPVRGFKLDLLTSSNEMTEFDWDNQGLNYYFVGMIALFVTSCGLLIIRIKHNWISFLVVLWITLVIYIIAGFRYRIVILVISTFSMYYLSDSSRMLRIIPIALVALICYVGFNIMDHSRVYGNGIDRDEIQSLSIEKLTTQATETERVYNFSILVMDEYEKTGKRVYFAPIVNAALMPIPRRFFPWKPKAEYLYEATKFVMKGESGSAYLFFVEAFMAFGWIGIIINGLFIGWLSRRFWNNYRKHPKSLGAILALALFNGVTYVIVSRGYLAQQFGIFIFFVCIPFWMTMLFNKLSIKKPIQ